MSQTHALLVFWSVGSQSGDQSPSAASLDSSCSGGQSIDGLGEVCSHSVVKVVGSLVEVCSILLSGSLTRVSTADTTVLKPSNASFCVLIQTFSISTSSCVLFIFFSKLDTSMLSNVTDGNLLGPERQILAPRSPSLVAV